ncbi:diguanylate cyclase domain-containing protein [Algicola sagamiensis]|uniref:diguanylate cyclase domain-containing protein n=1 Tax=Algicola sagamiensis TaxID=163869 RepID=UPI000360B34F|nr:diguanylate cyclase [Algicola sagamiensis]
MVPSFRNFSFRDTVTGLYTQAYFMEVMQREWHRMLREHEHLSLAQILPHVESNPTMADKQLNLFAHELESSLLRATDIACCLDNRTFAVGLFNLNMEGTTIVLERMLENLNHHIDPQMKSNQISIGAIYVVPDKTLSLEQAFHQMEDVAHQAEKDGKSCFRLKEVLTS